MTDKKYICTYFDFNYLPRGLALYYSIKRFHNDFDFFVLTFDDQSYNYLNNLKEENVKLISHKEYNSYFKTSEDKYTDKKQYFFSATPNLCSYLLDNHPDIDILLYLDADVYLFYSLDSLYNELGESSIGITEHRVNPLLKVFVKHYGKYVIGVNLFRNSETGLKCLKDWKSDCNEWYPGKPGYPLKFFSDQIFLDSWVEKYDGVKVIKNIGVNTSYWNAANYTFSTNGEVYFVNNQPLIIYHFSSLRKENDKTWNTYSIYGLSSVKNVLLEIYTKYIMHIESFGLSNKKWEKIKHRESIQKKIAHFILEIFINEKVVIK
jgi:hypothetical protein